MKDSATFKNVDHDWLNQKYQSWLKCKQGFDTFQEFIANELELKNFKNGEKRQ